MGIRLASKSSSGARFETLVDLSIARQCYAPPLPPVGGRFIKGKLTPQKMPFDRIIVHRRTGRAIAFDCKSCADPNRFPVGNPTHVAPHQVQNLIHAGSEGVISGLLIEASHSAVGLVYWLPWETLTQRLTSVTWGDQRMIEIGNTETVIDFDRIINVSLKKAV